MTKFILALCTLAFTSSVAMAQATPATANSPAPVNLITPEKAIDNAVATPSVTHKSTAKVSVPKAHKKPAHKAKKHNSKKHKHKVHKKHKPAAIIDPTAQ